jgi:hypothetical protein
MYISKSSSAGTFRVSIDFGTDVTVDGFSAQPQCAYAWSAFSLTSITHTVMVTTWDMAKTFELDHFM